MDRQTVGERKGAGRERGWVGEGRESGGRGAGEWVLIVLGGERSMRRKYTSRVDTSVTGNKHAKVFYRDHLHCGR